MKTSKLINVMALPLLLVAGSNVAAMETGSEMPAGTFGKGLAFLSDCWNTYAPVAPTLPSASDALGKAQETLQAVGDLAKDAAQTTGAYVQEGSEKAVAFTKKAGQTAATVVSEHPKTIIITALGLGLIGAATYRHYSNTPVVVTVDAEPATGAQEAQVVTVVTEQAVPAPIAEETAAVTEQRHPAALAAEQNLEAAAQAAKQELIAILSRRNLADKAQAIECARNFNLVAQVTEYYKQVEKSVSGRSSSGMKHQGKLGSAKILVEIQQALGL